MRAVASSLSPQASSTCQVSLPRLSLQLSPRGRLLGLFPHRRLHRFSWGSGPRFADPVINLTYYFSVDGFAILLCSLPIQTSLPCFLDFGIARSELYSSDNSFVPVQDPGDTVSEGIARHFHWSDLVQDNQVSGSVYATLQS